MSHQDTYMIRCGECGTKNRIPVDKMNDRASCGKCGGTLETEALFSGQPVVVSDSNFDAKVLKSPLPVLLYCWATWCGTCKATAPIIEDFARSSKGRVRVAKLNADSSPALTAKYNILSLPFILVFDNGQLKQSFPGTMAKHDLMMKMAPYI